MFNEHKRTLVLLSGGLDSAVAAEYLRDKGYEIIAGLFINRGQSNYRNEKRAVLRISKYLNMKVYFAQFSLLHLEEILSHEMRMKVGIPGRNLILASMALSYMYALSCEVLALGNTASDVFPDSNKEFRAKFTETAIYALDKKIKVIAPLADLERWDKARSISFAERIGQYNLLELTWSCWKAGKMHCGTCAACIQRKEAFAAAELRDLTKYAGDK